MPVEFIIRRAHRNDYDHAVRAAGAKFIDVGFGYCTFPYEVETAITPRTAGLYYQAGVNQGVLPLEQYSGIAHCHGPRGIGGCRGQDASVFKP